MLKVSCAFIVHSNKILIVQNGIHSDHPFQWEFPGGKIKEEENGVDCIKREIREELDLEIEVIQPMYRIIHDYGFKKIELIPFLCVIKSGTLILKEHNKNKWANIEELNKFDFSGADKKLIQNKNNWKLLEKYIREQMHNS